MPFFDLITNLEEVRKSRVVVYITGTKTPIFGAKIANDVLPLFKKILEKLPAGTEKISLFLNTTGGNLDAPWPLVNLIREYCAKFEVIVPSQALSAGTLIALGADKIVMLPYSHLSPIDPATEIVDTEKKQQKRIEIEDIIGYINFTRDKIGIKDQPVLGDVIKELGKEINPTMLGAANRTHSLIRSLATNLLSLHTEKPGGEQGTKIVNHLTEKLYSHRHLINRREAADVVGFGDIIEFADAATKSAVDALFEFYLEYLEIEKEFNPQTVLNGVPEADYRLPRASVHSSDLHFSFVSNYHLAPTEGQGGQKEIAVNNNFNRWEKVDL